MPRSSVKAVTSVTGKNQVTIPAKIASAMGISSGSRIEWRIAEEPSSLSLHILPDRRSIAAALRGAGRKFLKPVGASGQNSR